MHLLPLTHTYYTMKINKNSIIFLITILATFIVVESIYSGIDHYDTLPQDGRQLGNGGRRTTRLRYHRFRIVCRACLLARKRIIGHIGLGASINLSCCGKKCINLMADRHHCGACGKRCGFNEICCKGKCVNPWFSRVHCGRCGNGCGQGGGCAFGLCNYADV